MSDRHDIDTTPAQRAAQAAVRGLSRPQADPDFRRRLKADFTSGALATPARAEPPRAKIIRLSGAALVAAAVLAVAVLGLGSLPGPQLAGVQGDGRVVVDGTAVSAADRDAVAALLRPGARVALEGDVSLDVLYPGTSIWRLAPGTVFTLPGRPGRWLGRSLNGDLEIGEVSVRTGPRLAGNALVIATDEGNAVVTGTLVDVFRNEAVTCICLIEGHCRVTTPAEDLGDLPPNKRWVLSATGEAPALLDIAPPHREHMLELDRAQADAFAPTAR